MTNIEAWVKNALPVEIYLVVRGISCNDCFWCPAKEMCRVKKSYEGEDPPPLQCANAFKKWALKGD